MPDDLALRHLARIVDSSDDAIISKDLNGTILSWNAAAERMFGYTPAEAVGRSIRMIIPADRQDEEDFVLAQIRSGQAVQHYETIRQRKDGSRIPISLTVSPIHDDHGTVIAASKIARDMTERTQLLSSAQEQAEIARQLTEIGVIVASSLDRTTVEQQVIDVATRLTHAELGAFVHGPIDGHGGTSDQLRTLSGTSKAAFGRWSRSRVLFAPIDRIVRVDDVTQDARFEDPPSEETPAERPPVRSYLAVPVLAPTGAVLGGLFFVHSQVGVFSAPHEQLATGIAAWASVALENARLYAAAREADRLKDEFLAVLSHELRTPLNAILGYARLLRGGILRGDKAARGLETLERNASGLTQIVEDVLDMSHIVSGKIRLHVEPVELQVIVHNAVATVQPAADAKGVRLQTIVDSRIGPVSGDPDRLQQVVWNLLSNAVKFTPRRGRVQVRLARVTSHVELVVSDTGMGIRGIFLPHVFERFRQADAGFTRTNAGLGLGLSIVRHIVEMHGGAVQASSDGEGRGATFCVQLPLFSAHDPVLLQRDGHLRTEQRPPPVALADLSGVRVLAIDDEPDALGLVRIVLESAGATVATASSGLDALQQMPDFCPDALIVALGMPHLDGFELIARLRHAPDPRLREIPAAALTAFARSDDRIRALQAGFQIHLAKPVDPGELIAAVATLVARDSP